MRPGPSSDVLAAPLSVGVEVAVVRGGQVLASRVPVDSARLEWASDRVVPAQLTYDAPLDWAPQAPMDPLGRFGQRSVVTAVCQSQDGSTWRVPLGQYLHTSWRVTDRAVSVTAVDLMQVLEDDPMAWPSSPEPGATLRSEMQRLAGSLPVVLDEGVVDRHVPVSAQWGRSRSESVVKLAASCGAGVRTGADGCLHVHPMRDGSTVDAVYESAVLPGRRGNGLLLDAPPAPAGSSRLPNRWLVTGTSSQGGHDTKWVSTRTVADAPFDPDGYGWVTLHQELSSAASQADVDQAADSLMRSSLQAVVSRSIEIVPDPRLEAGDVITALASSGEILVGRVAAWSLPLSDPGAAMRVDIDLLQW